ncbi:damage-inducible protein CinA [Devosia sp. Root413D1]|uniref:CinA family protein n=1 Tax=Devosia sp. Root413D1 TaxID=1736531 RepID=UPI0006F4B7AF|nr:nicotinamide-nucleotide amidohydrolase family protein [Devosia sp. Root413D1]KQW81561.1 damage-inducible protein CinA [Devosia sp. Root413D1]
MKLPDDIAALAEETVAALKAAGMTVATAESCTGGLIAGALTAISGSSDVVYGGFVSYANEAKISMIGVPFGLLKQFGAVSKEVAMAMADGAIGAAGTHVAIAVTGIAGPTGGSADKPVGLVHFSVATEAGTTHLKKVFPGNRDDVRHATVVQALKLLLKAAKA